MRSSVVTDLKSLRMCTHSGKGKEDPFALGPTDIRLGRSFAKADPSSLNPAGTVRNIDSSPHGQFGGGEQKVSEIHELTLALDCSITHLFSLSHLI